MIFSLVKLGLPTDSWYLWHSFLKCRRLSDDAVLIAVDLPGYGGSDSFPVHDAQTVLEALAVFILEMRKTYLPVDESDLQTRGPVVVVGHDWGAMVGFRLAAEAAGLADRFILSNSIHVGLPRYSHVSLAY
jgi:pimeloyl-ACP methyl ester carboxylesterase